MTTRKFCAKCRIKKCFAVGMKKEWILTDDEKLMIKERRMTINYLRLQKSRALDAKFQEPKPESNAKQLLKQKIIKNQQEQENLKIQNSIASIEEPVPVSESLDVELINLNNLTFDPPSMALVDLSNAKQREHLANSDFEFSSELEKYCDQILTETGGDDMSSIELSFDSEELEDLIKNQDYISNYLMLLNYKVEDLCCSCMCREIRFPKHDLILPEKYLLKDLINACVVLKNPYKRILYYRDVYNCPSGQKVRVSPYLINRMNLMCQKLEPLKQLPKMVQEQLLQCSLIEMLIIQSVLFCDPDRGSWGLLDDKFKATVMVPMTIIKPYCFTHGFDRHKNLPKLFREEWKADNIIMDLVTAIILFTPRHAVGECESIRQAQIGYIRLLQRYLRIKYQTQAEAEECFQKLLNNIEEIRALSVDVINFFSNYVAPDSGSANSRDFNSKLQAIVQ